ncbi:MAG: GreA/GreB family elongation factor, partial [Paludibacteraceae bacterium]|nr:GreA/GreB family elongation factor [Paludibacteraceae bacterium]
MLNKVELLNLKNNQKVTYTIVSETESNLREGKIAASTPIAKALIGKAKGEKVSVKVPAGVLEFEILNISL